MRRQLTLLVLVTGVAFGETEKVTVSDEVVQKGVQRFGVNLGAPNEYGAENFMRNMIPNPGYEPCLFGTVVSVYKASGNKVQGDYWNTDWHTPVVGQPEGF